MHKQEAKTFLKRGNRTPTLPPSLSSCLNRPQVLSPIYVTQWPGWEKPKGSAGESIPQFQSCRFIPLQQSAVILWSCPLGRGCIHSQPCRLTQGQVYVVGLRETTLNQSLRELDEDISDVQSLLILVEVQRTSKRFQKSPESATFWLHRGFRYQTEGGGRALNA